jgi:hypothetical protein
MYNQPPGGPNWLPNAANTAATVAAAHNNLAAERRATARGLVVGGAAGLFVGYLIGRRRGRIKTEKKLLPVQKKLEAQVTTIQAQVAEKETAIRKLAREHAEEVKILQAPKPAEQQAQTLRQEAPRTSQAERPAEQAKETIPAPPVNRSEHLGLATLKALEVPVAAVTPRAEQIKPTTIEQAKAAKIPVETLPLKDVVAVAETIPAGATTLNRVYETNLISERGLRRVVAEARRGGNVARVLQEELLIKELSYERDPRMRDRQLKALQSAGFAGVAAQAALSNQIGANGQTDATPADNDATKAFNPSQQTSQKRPTPHPLVVANVAALVVLAILVVVLILMRVG